MTGAGILCRTEYVYAFTIGDNPGALNQLLTAVDEIGFNLEYVYMSFDRETGHPIAAFQAHESDGMEEALMSRGFLRA